MQVLQDTHVSCMRPQRIQRLSAAGVLLVADLAARVSGELNICQVVTQKRHHRIGFCARSNMDLFAYLGTCQQYASTRISACHSTSNIPDSKPIGIILTQVKDQRSGPSSFSPQKATTFNEPLSLSQMHVCGVLTLSPHGRNVGVFKLLGVSFASSRQKLPNDKNDFICWRCWLRLTASSPPTPTYSPLHPSRLLFFFILHVFTAFPSINR